MEAIAISGEMQELVLDALRRSSWFGSLLARPGGGDAGAVTVEQLVRWSELRRCNAGAVVVERGFPSDAFFLLLRGGMTIHLGDAAAPVSGRLRPPASFGEVGLLLDEPRTATLLAAEDSLVLRFSAEAFHEMMRRLPGFGLDTSRHLARRLRELSDAVD